MFFFFRSFTLLTHSIKFGLKWSGLKVSPINGDHCIVSQTLNLHKNMIIIHVDFSSFKR